MAGNIKGITIEIGGDTTGLDKALSSVNKQSKDLQDELKQVDRLLKFNPGNAELVAQKQELLAKQIETTSKKLNQLKEAQAQVDAQFASGKINEEQYRAFQRELVATQGQLDGLTGKLSSIEQEQERAAQSTKQLSTLFESAGTSVDDYAEILGTKLVNAIKNGTATSQQLDAAFQKISNTTFSNFDKAIQSTSSEIEKVRKEFALQEAVLASNGTETEKLSSKLTYLQSSQMLVGRQIQETEQQLEKAKATFGENSIEAEKLSQKLLDSQIAYQKLGNQIVGAEQELNRLGSSQRQLQTLFNATETSVDQFSSALGSELTNAIKNGTASAKQLDEALAKIGQEALGSSIDIDKMKQALSSVDDGASLDSVRKDLSNVAKEAKQAGDEVNGFGSELSNVIAGLAAGGGISGAISAALDTSSLNTKIDISMEVPESSKASVKEAINTVSSYGVDAEAALEGVRRQWALNKDASDESNQAVVTMAGTIAAAYAGVDFTELIQEGNEIAATLGITNEEAMGLVNTLLKTGFPPEQLDIIAEYGDQMIQAGFTAKEVQAIMSAGVDTKTWNIDNLLDGIKEGRIQMADFGSGLDKSMKEIIAQTDISEKQFVGWGQAIAKGGEGGQKAMLEATKALAGVKNETDRNQLGTKMFGTMWEEQGMKIVDTIIKAEEKTVDLQKGIDDVNSSTGKLNTDPTVAMRQAFFDLKEALEPILSGIAEVISKIAEWISANPTLAATIAAVVTAIGLIVAIFAALAPIITGITALWPILVTAIGAISAPIAIAIGVITGLIVIGTLLWQKWDSVSAFLKTCWEGIKTAATTVFNAIGTFLKTCWEGIKSVTTTMWNGIKSLLSILWNGLKSTATTVFNALKTAITTVWNTIKSTTSTVWNGIKSLLSTLWNGLKSTATTVFNALKIAVTTVWNTIKSTTSTVWNGIKSLLSTLWNGLKSSASTIFNAIKIAISTVWNGIKSTTSTVWNAIKSVLSGLWNGLKSAATSLFNGIKSVVSGVWNGIKSLTSSVWNSIKSVVTSVWNGIKSSTTTTVNAIKNTVSKVFNSLKTTVSTAMNNVKSAIESGWTKAKSFLQGINLSTIGRNIIDGLVNGIKGTAGRVASAVKSIADGIPSTIKKMLGIHSPSRVMRDEVGYWISEGLAKGIEANTKPEKKAKEKAQQIVKSFNSDLKDLQLDYKADSINTTQYISKLNKLKTEYKNYSTGVKQINAEIAKAEKIVSDSLKKTYDTRMSSLEEQYSYGEITTKQYISKLKSLQKQYGNDVTGATKEINRKIAQLEEQQSADLLAQYEDRYDDEVKYNNMSITQQIAYWKKRKSEFKKDSEEYAEISDKLKDLELQKTAELLETYEKEFTNEVKYNNMSIAEQVAYWEKRKSKFKKDSKEYAEISDKLKDLELQKTAELLDTYEKEFTNEVKYNDMTLVEQIAYWKKRKSEFKKDSKEYAEISDKLKDLELQKTAELLDIYEKEFTNEVKYNNMTLVEQIDYWENRKQQFKKDSKEYAKIGDNLKELEYQQKQEMLTINEDYLSKVQALNQKMIDEENRLTAEYQKAVDDRAKSLYSFAGLFDEVTKASEVSGAQLLANLQGQVTTFSQWQRDVATLAARGVDKGLIAELQEMGPKSAAEIAALNTLSDEQLAQYATLWQEKSNLARTQAISELEGMRIDTANQIVALKEETKTKLEEYQIEWQTSMKAVTNTTKDQFKDMPSIGSYAVQGLIDGMREKKDELAAVAAELAAIVAGTVQSDLDIHSPSRVFKGFGVNVNEGFIQGLQASAARLKNAMSNVYGTLANSAQTIMGNTSTVTHSTSSVDNSKHFQPSIIIQTTESPERAVRRELDKLAFKF
jgi:phage-related minor tail protein